MPQVLLNPIVCEAPFNFAAGLVFVQGQGYRVGMMQPHFVAIRHVSADEARAFADELAAETGTELAPVTDALRAAADNLDALGLPGVEVDGHG